MPGEPRVRGSVDVPLSAHARSELSTESAARTGCTPQNTGLSCDSADVSRQVWWRILCSYHARAAHLAREPPWLTAMRHNASARAEAGGRGVTPRSAMSASATIMHGGVRGGAQNRCRMPSARRQQGLCATDNPTRNLCAAGLLSSSCPTTQGASCRTCLMLAARREIRGA